MRGESSANGRNTFKIYVNETITFSFPRNYLSKTARILRPSGRDAWRSFMLFLKVCSNSKKSSQPLAKKVPTFPCQNGLQKPKNRPSRGHELHPKRHRKKPFIIEGLWREFGAIAPLFPTALRLRRRSEVAYLYRLRFGNSSMIFLPSRSI